MAIKIDYNPVAELLKGASLAGGYAGADQAKQRQGNDIANAIQMAMEQQRFNEQARQFDANRADKQTAMDRNTRLQDESTAMGGYYRKADDINATDKSSLTNDAIKAETKKLTAQALLDEYKAKELTAKTATSPTKIDNSATDFEFKKLSTSEKSLQSDVSRDMKTVAQMQKDDAKSESEGLPPKNGAAIKEINSRLAETNSHLQQVRQQRDALTVQGQGGTSVAKPQGLQATQSLDGRTVISQGGPTAQAVPPTSVQTSEQINSVPIEVRKTSVVNRLSSDPALQATVRALAADRFNNDPAFKGIGLSFEQFLQQTAENLGTRGTLDMQTAQAILQQAGGDKTKARALAILDGWVTDI